VRWAAVRAAPDARSAKLHTRLGMGACQGRVCGAAMAVLRGVAPGAVRPPLSPVRLETLTRGIMSVDWKGIFPAITTPFAEDGSIDHAFLAPPARWLAAAGCAGLIPVRPP